MREKRSEPRGRIWGRSPNGFTLLEMLASLAVFAILLSILFGILNVSVQLIRTSEQLLTANEEARIVFDQMDRDWETRLRFSTSQFGIIKGTAAAPNDEIWWNCQVPALSAGRGFSSCDFKIAADSAWPNPTLQRAVQAYNWDISTNSGNLSGTNLFLVSAPSQPISATFQTLSPGVVRMEINPVILTSGTRSYGTTLSTFSSSNYLGFYVTLVCVDQITVAKLSSTQYNNIVLAFAKPTTGTSVYKTWQGILTSSASIPAVGRQNLGIFERYYNWDQ